MQASTPTPPAPATATGATAADGNAPRSLDVLRQLLERGRYSAAIDWYDSAYRALDEADNQAHRELILGTARAFMAAENHAAAQQLLEAYVALFHKDVEALLMLAESQHIQTQYAAAIETLYMALAEAYEPQHIERLRMLLDNATAKRAVQIAGRESQSAVIGFYEALLIREPNHGPYQWGLVRANLNAQRIDAAIAALDRIDDPRFVERAAELREVLERRQLEARSQAVAIPLTPYGRGFVVRAVLNGHHAVDLLIDTGASMTAIRPEALARAGLTASHTRRVQRFATANGPVDAPVVALRSFQLGSTAVGELEVGSIALPGLAVDGLLGMNFLEHFEFSINRSNNVMYLTRQGSAAM